MKPTQVAKFALRPPQVTRQRIPDLRSIVIQRLHLGGGSSVCWLLRDSA